MLKDATKEDKALGAKYVEYEKIKSYLTGIARVIHFQKNSHDENYILTEMYEGKIENGVVNGYCRNLKVT